MGMKTPLPCDYIGRAMKAEDKVKELTDAIAERGNPCRLCNEIITGDQYYLATKDLLVPLCQDCFRALRHGGTAQFFYPV